MDFTLDKKVINKVKLKDKKNDLSFWLSTPYSFRLEAVEKIRQEYNNWKYGTEQGFQRVYRIIKSERC